VGSTEAALGLQPVAANVSTIAITADFTHCPFMVIPPSSVLYVFRFYMDEISWSCEGSIPRGSQKSSKSGLK
jgi:hypothetical protein